MYLNVKLAPPTSGEATCTTPKTPEILNSIIGLTSPVQTSQYESHEAICDASSPIDNSHTFEEYSSFVCEEYPLFHGKAMPNGNSPAYDNISKNLEYTFGMGSSSIGTPSPPVPELPSPVQPVEATKTALIKEGLKHQIQTKLNAAGITSTVVFSEQKDFKEVLTHEDEERRRRRRERNKVAATKCRNKKKERTSILVNESEEVEGENFKLKSEIQRLKNEKMKLEKLLDDPSHLACCLRTNGVSEHLTSGAVTLPNVTCTQHLPSAEGHYTVPSITDCSRESTGTSYSTLSNPSPNTTPSYMYNHNDKILFGTSVNKLSSKFSSYPLTCADSLKSISESEEADSSFMPLASLSTENVDDELRFNKSELSTVKLSTVPFPQCIQNTLSNITTGNYSNHVMSKSIVELGQIDATICSSKVFEPKQTDRNTICNSGEDCFSVKDTGIREEYTNVKLNPIKTGCFSKFPKVASRFFPYERNITANNHTSDYSEHSLQNGIFDTNLCSRNIDSTYTTECNRQFYPACTYESI